MARGTASGGRANGDLRARTAPAAAARRSRRRTETTGEQAPPYGLDDADRTIVELMADDARVSNRTLATATGLTDATIATRVARLRELALLHPTAQLDVRLLGYTTETEILIGVTGCVPRAVAQQVARLDGVHATALLLGKYDITAFAFNFDPDERDRLLAEVSAIPGVSTIDPSPVVRWHKRVIARGAIREHGVTRLDLSRALVALDDLDAKLIHALVDDSRQSNRAIGRALAVGESTIRTRLRRLEECGLLRVVGVADRTALRMNGDVAEIHVEVEGDAGPLAARIAAWPETAACYTVLSGTPLRALVVTAGPNQLGELISDRLRALPGIRRAHTLLNVERISHNYLLTPFA